MNLLFFIILLRKMTVVDLYQQVWCISTEMKMLFLQDQILCFFFKTRNNDRHFIQIGIRWTLKIFINDENRT